jgi:hypothetical protein
MSHLNASQWEEEYEYDDIDNDLAIFNEDEKIPKI